MTAAPKVCGNHACTLTAHEMQGALELQKAVHDQIPLSNNSNHKCVGKQSELEDILSTLRKLVWGRQQQAGSLLLPP